MEKLQFLDLSDLSPGEEEQLTRILYNEDCLEAVELPPETLPPAWVQHPVPYQSEPAEMGELEQVEVGEVDYATGSPMMAPHSMQYTQMIPAPSVYVSNVTANVNVHGFVPQAMPYAPVPFIPPADPRKPRPAKTPTKRSPEARRTIDTPQTNFPTSPFPQAYYPAGPVYSPYWVLPHQLPRPFVAPVYTPPSAPFPQPVFSPTQHVQPPSERREENPVPYPDAVEESAEQPYDSEDVAVEEPGEEQAYTELSDEQEPAAEEAPAPVEEVKVEKPLVAKAPPASAFISAPAHAQKPPFPTGPSKYRPVDNGPEFVDPPVESGPPKKSYASLFGSGDRASQMIQMESSPASKPLAMIHPTVHNNVNSASQAVNGRDKPEVMTHNLSMNKSFSKPAKERAEQMVLADYDINITRLGEFLTSYNLDHKPLALQPRGLTNRSNYCYINAILQALVACPSFYNLMRAIPPTQEKGTKSRTPIVDSM